MLTLHYLIRLGRIFHKTSRCSMRRVQEASSIHFLFKPEDVSLGLPLGDELSIRLKILFSGFSELPNIFMVRILKPHVVLKDLIMIIILDDVYPVSHPPP